jgi:hypothetical protein
VLQDDPGQHVVESQHVHQVVVKAIPQPSGNL